MSAYYEYLSKNIEIAEAKKTMLESRISDLKSPNLKQLVLIGAYSIAKKVDSLNSAQISLKKLNKNLKMWKHDLSTYKNNATKPQQPS